MPGLEDLFKFGSVSKEIEIGEFKVRLSVLDSKHLQDALNASYGPDEYAKLLDYKKNVLARAITIADGVKYIENAGNPTQEEVKNLSSIIDKLHVMVVNRLYDAYDAMDLEIKKHLDVQVKN